MRLLSYSAHGDSSFGVLTPDGTGVVDLASRVDGVLDLGDLIAQGRLGEAARWSGSGADHALHDVAFERLLPRPGKIICIGVNYGGRGAEYAEDRGDAYPSVFVRFPETLVGHEQPLLRPPESAQLDCEGELVVGIGTGGRRSPIARDRKRIAGVSLCD
ncbi:MAG: fumarylacetoacetate hydrolase family protein, partial [Acidimicrobiaceae bacterium]|nr:fumarylacetoacetate hydrolase family protein [Acidimicrobiaceae bacterium]